MVGSKFSAVDATLGYAYQIRCALVYSLRHARDGDEFTVGLETLDDVTFSNSGGEPFDLLQTKHHSGSKSALTDASVDLWKTFRIWIEGRNSKSIPTSAKLYLITTSDASSGSAADKLRPNIEDRDVAGALTALNNTALSSTNQTNKEAYAAFSALSQAQREALLAQTYVIDSSPKIADLDEELRKQIRWLCAADLEDAFLERLEGWWFRRVLKQLTGATGLIESKELDLHLEELREQFKREALPIDDDILTMELDEALLGTCQGRVFIKQLEFVTDNSKRIGIAIRDYFRAYEQRARWLRQDIIRGLELDKYENRLIEEWQLTYESMRDEIGDSAADDIMKKAGMSMLQWAEKSLYPIRPSVTEPFVTRGSLHMLADEKKIGWHPKFQERLEVIFAKAGAL